MKAIISFLRTLLFQTTAILLLPLVWKPAVDGIWVSIVAAEASAAIITVIFLIANKKEYKY